MILSATAFQEFSRLGHLNSFDDCLSRFGFHTVLCSIRVILILRLRRHSHPGASLPVQWKVDFELQVLQ